MLQKCFLYVRAFMRASTLLIVFILLVTFYFYGDKIREVANPYIEQSKKSGILFYAIGIWDNMKGVQQVTDQQNQRAMELVGNTKTINEKTGLYSFSVPQDWNISLEQGAIGTQLSKMVIASPPFSQRSVASDIFYDNGGQLSIQVLKGELASAKSTDGGYGKVLVSKKNIAVDTESSAYYIITDLDVQTGEIIEAPIIHAGNTYVFRFVFNPARYGDGEYTFNEILASFKFKDAENKK